MKTANKKIEKLREVKTLIDKMLIEMEATLFIADVNNNQNIDAKRESIPVINESKQ